MVWMSCNYTSAIEAAWLTSGLWQQRGANHRGLQCGDRSTSNAQRCVMCEIQHPKIAFNPSNVNLPIPGVEEMSTLRIHLRVIRIRCLVRDAWLMIIRLR